jgi:hypothetical protein
MSSAESEFKELINFVSVEPGNARLFCFVGGEDKIQKHLKEVVLSILLPQPPF